MSDTPALKLSSLASYITTYIKLYHHDYCLYVSSGDALEGGIIIVLGNVFITYVIVPLLLPPSLSLACM